MDKNGKDECQIYDTNDLEEKVRKVDMKMPSPTNLLAKSSLKLPTEVIKPKCVEQERMKTKIQTVSSGSATGKNA